MNSSGPSTSKAVNKSIKIFHKFRDEQIAEMRRKANQRRVQRRLKQREKKKQPKKDPAASTSNTASTVLFTDESIIADPTSDEDDCMLVEQQIEQIVIVDDDQTALSESTADSTIPDGNGTAAGGPLVTSTPLGKAKEPTPPRQLGGEPPTNTSVVALTDDSKCETTLQPAEKTITPAAADSTTRSDESVQKGGDSEKEEGEITDTSTLASKSLFYEDKTRTPWFETVDSVEDFTPRPSRTERRRQRDLVRGGDGDTAAVCLAKDNSVVVVLDDTLVNDDCTMDDSVVFISETKKQQATDYIPLVANDVPNPMPWSEVVRESNKKAISSKKKKNKNALFTSREERELSAYNNNAYNPSGDSEQLGKKRLVLVDGSNVAFNHGLNQVFSVKGIEIALKYFEMMGHEVKAVVPQFRLQKTKSTDPETLEKLHRSGKIVFTPCKNLPGLYATSYDDRFILQLASTLDAAIVSNDYYRDLIHENAAFKKIIENRVIGYTWCNDIFMLPKDPYGRLGPQLDAILNRS